MKLIILTSGTGKRLMPLTANTPKALIDLGNGMTLLETNLKNIAESKVIDEVVLVIGYCADQIEAKIKKYQHQGMKIKTVYNPFYEVSNNLMTLWMAKPEMNEDFMITNGDNILQPEVYAQLATKKNGIYLTTSLREDYRADDMKVIIKEGSIDRVSKQIAHEEASAESVGLALLSGEKHREIFRANLEELARDKAYLNKFWLEVFNRMADKGVHITPFEIDGEKLWVEIDFHGDLNEVISSLIKRKITKLDDEKATELKGNIRKSHPHLEGKHVERLAETLPENREALRQSIPGVSLSEQQETMLLETIRPYVTALFKN